ncbi:membrane-targeted effector domain-containing toxin [Biostraticola tofi]|uniref:Multifunctional autoprocessing RTX toxin-like protein n=1 Tax=Biostraticola tofi TaxID=466109 RepID=A0A4R3Z225_9GAMM|nr:membrane-targeted effector domain-containing toxin [Biostraticola tofi]TCV99823.1 multifunctional autoprocessing RTX toxin-like protein [Biostraticola tofi]
MNVESKDHQSFNYAFYPSSVNHGDKRRYSAGSLDKPFTIANARPMLFAPEKFNRPAKRTVSAPNPKGWLSRFIGIASPKTPSPEEGDASELTDILQQGAQLMNGCETANHERPAAGNVRRQSWTCLSKKLALGLGLMTLGTGAFAFGQHKWQQITPESIDIDDDVNNSTLYPLPSSGMALRIDMYPPPDTEAIGEYMPPMAEAYVLPKTTTTTETIQPEDVGIELLDFSCMAQRQNLSLAQVLRQIGKTLANPVLELAREAQIVHFFNRFGRCPSAEDINHLIFITSKVDAMMSIITSLIPNANALIIMQRIGGPAFQMIADDIEGKEINVNLLDEVDSQALFLAKSIVEFSPKNENGKVNENEITIPKNILIKDGKFLSPIQGKLYEITYEKDFFFASRGAEKRQVRYSHEENAWIFSDISANLKPHVNDIERELIDNNENMVLQRKKETFQFDSSIATEIKNISPIDLNSASLANPDRWGIYTYFQTGIKKRLSAIKVDGRYYKVNRLSGKGTFEVGDKSDLEIIRFDNIYYKSRKKEKAKLDYSSCRIARSPTSQCAHFSSGLIEILEKNQHLGIPEIEMPDYRLDHSRPGLYRNSKNKLFIKYNDVFFKLNPENRRKPDEIFSIMAKKSGSILRIVKRRKVAELCVSREKGRYYLNTSIENMMESAGTSREAAALHSAIVNMPVRGYHAYEIPAKLRETIKAIPRTMLKDNHELTHSETRLGPVVDHYRRIAKKLRADTDIFFENNYIGNPAYSDRPDIPSFAPSTASNKIIEELYSKTDGIVIGEYHSSVASKKFLIENMATFYDQGVRTLYLEHFQSDMHQADLDSYFETGCMPKKLRNFVIKLDREQYTDPLKKYNFLETLKAAQKEKIRPVAIDSFISYYDPAMRMVYNRIRVMNYYAHLVISENQIKNPKKWISLVGSSHMNMAYAIPGVAELNRAIGIRFEDVGIGKPDNIQKDYGTATYSGNTSKGVILQGDLLISIGTQEQEMLSRFSDLNAMLNTRKKFTIREFRGKNYLFYKNINRDLMKAPIEFVDNKFYLASHNIHWKNICEMRFDRLSELVTVLTHGEKMKFVV